ncbi:HECT-domain (ubiquitin-transferase) domain-containing protein [Sarocladium implicatum]|nr:HECT-domain (ubiquitin-transferase) domain-containing protein [Sarocladium implicatum]
MGKITKPMQAKHRETLSPWLAAFVDSVSEAPIPLLPAKLSKFPSRWPFGRGDLYHWTPLLNRFDTILEHFSKTYQLNQGPQLRDFGCELLLSHNQIEDFGETKQWTKDELAQLGYLDDGDRELIECVLKFTRMLVDNCGNRSIYASSTHLNDLLNTTSLTILIAALEVGSELAQRYQASVKRISHQQSRHISSQLLANHYNIELDRVQQLALPFVKTPLIRLSDGLASPSPAASGKSRDKNSIVTSNNAAVSHANDLIAISTSDDVYWKGWGDVKVTYYPDASATAEQFESGRPSAPSTPTPLRRSSTTTPQQHTSRSRNFSADDSSPITPRTSAQHEDVNSSGQKSFEVPQSVVVATSIYDLIRRIPDDMSPAAKYEAFHRLRVAKALTSSQEQRQKLLATRLLAITNLAYIHPEASFIEKVLRHDVDETRRYQLVYQLAELIHPPAETAANVPLWIQTIGLGLIEAVAGFQAKNQDVLSALNANVNHGVLLYVIRKAVAGMREDTPDQQGDTVTETDAWRTKLFSLTLFLAMMTRVGSEMVSAGLMEILVEMLKLRSEVAQRHHSMVLAFLDSLIWTYQNAFTAFFNADGLDAIADLIVDTVRNSKSLREAGEGTQVDQQSGAVDYRIPYYQQQTLKWLLKFVHHIMSNSFSFSGNTDRLLRNLADKSDLLSSLRQTIEDKESFGSIVWTHSVTILSDFINNDPTSFAAISESGMIRTFLEAITGNKVDDIRGEETSNEAEEGEDTQSPTSNSGGPIVADGDVHPPPDESLRQSQPPKFANGILPSSDAIAVVPAVLNSISLNPTGMKLVVESRALESFLQIFESPEHVKCMQEDQDQDLAGNVGGSFDELARHHPRLRKAIANAVVDMVARIRILGIDNAERLGWGAQLLDISGDFNHGIDDASRIAKHGQQEEDRAKASDSDIPMQDAGALSAPAQQADEPDGKQSKQGEFTPYVYAMATFLAHYLGNVGLRDTFIEQGGIELLLDLVESPSLPDNFGSVYASKAMVTVLKDVIDACPIRGLPSLLNRTQAALNVLQPLASQTEASPPYFAKFIMVQPPAATDKPGPDSLAAGTQVVKAFLNSQQFLRILAECFQTIRGGTSFYPINVYDLYLRLFETIGPLIRGILAEEMAELKAVPLHWNFGRQDSASELTGASRAALDADGATLPEVINATEDLSARGGADDAKPAVLSPREEASAQYRNYKVLRSLQHLMVPQVFPLFQSAGKALFPKRDVLQGDTFHRARQLDIAKSLGQAILGHLEPSTAVEGPATHQFHYWTIMLHTIQELLVDRTPSRDRGPSTSLIMPVLLSFKEQNGLKVLNSMMASFASVIRLQGDAVDEATSKIAVFGLKKVLDLFYMLVNGKMLHDSCNAFTLQKSRDRHVQPSLVQQLVIEFRSSILPAVTELWQSSAVDNLPDAVVRRLLEIMKVIAQAEYETPASLRDKEPFALLKYQDARFNWRSYHPAFIELREQQSVDDLLLEAIFRSYGDVDLARQYYESHRDNRSGARNPIPPEDADTSALLSEETTTRTDQADADPETSSHADEMSLDAVDVADILTNVLSASHEPQETAETSQPTDTSVRKEASSTREQLDELRSALKEDLIDRCLDVIRAHPEVVIEVSDLIQHLLLRGKQEAQEEDVGSTLASALSSLAFDSEEKGRNAKCIAAYAHLLAMLLKDEKFLDQNVETLRDNVGEYIGYLKVAPDSNEPLPPWVPFILLILEILLCRDARPAEVEWAPPKSLDDESLEAVLKARTPFVTADERRSVLEHVLDLLPRVGQEEILATSVLRMLVILTRSRPLAKLVGSKRNLQRLFLMAKQLSGFGSERMRQIKASSHILTILRHVIEDEDTIKQVMRTEILNDFPHMRLNSARQQLDLTTFMRAMAPTALREPDIFVEVMTEMFHFSRWVAPNPESGRTAYLVLKENFGLKGDPNRSTPSASDVKPSTETGDKDMADVPRASDAKRPLVDNPDGVVHFLLCELLAYREVDDVAVNTDSKPDVKTGAKIDNDQGAVSGTETPAAVDDREKKPTKPLFKPEENPIFIYRCFLLSCLTELLQSYNKAKVEFINFKRSAPPVLATATPVKPRSSILNYLIYDLLGQGNLSGTADTIESKKRAAVSQHTQKVLVALVAKPKERSRVPSQDKFTYDNEPDLLFVRKFVLDIVLKAYEKAPSSDVSLEVRYSRMLALAELMNHMIGDRDKDVSTSTRGAHNGTTQSHYQMRRLMYEKGYLDKLTSSIAEINLSFPGVKRAIKYILRVLRILTDTAKELSQLNILPSDSPVGEVDEDLASSSSLSSLDDTDREETPDLYRNSALGMLEPRGEDDDSEDDSEEEDEDMYGEEYDEEMDYGEEDLSDREDNISDEDELTHMGEIEGLHGEPGVVEVIMDDDHDDDSESSDEDDDDDMDSEDIGDGEDIEIIDEAEEDGESEWESDSDAEQDEDPSDNGLDYEEDIQVVDEQEGLDPMGPTHLNRLARVMMGGDEEQMIDELEEELDEHYIEDDDHDEDEDEDDDEVEDEFIYDDYPDLGDIGDQMPSMALGWDGHNPDVADRHRHFVVSINDGTGRSRPLRVGPRSFVPVPGGGPMGHRDIGDFRSFFTRAHRTGPPPSAEDGVNPLLRRTAAMPEPQARRRYPNNSGWPLDDNPSQPGFDGTMAILGELAQALPPLHGGRAGDVAFQLRIRGPNGLREQDFPPLTRSRGERRDGSISEPQQAVSFPAESTLDRYQEEIRMLFGSSHANDLMKLVTRITAKLTPAAMELERKVKAEEAEKRKKEEEERQQREEEQARQLAREAEEKAERERKEAEEREVAERAARDAAATEASQIRLNENEPMEGIENATAASPVTQTSQPAVPVEPRVTTMLNGEEVDVTELGIDPDYLAALPEEFRAEVIAQAVSSRRSQAREEDAPGESTEVFREFLDALPDELRMEIEQQERQDQRRRARDDRRLVTPAGVPDATATDMDTASILLTFPPALRDQVLLDQGSELMDQLPPAMAAQARALSSHFRQNMAERPPPQSHGSAAPEAQGEPAKEDAKPQRRAIVQMLDKAGVATLLRLMFIAQPVTIRNYLFSVFADVCENRQNRIEVISTVLQILQEGSVDMHAVERSFGHLSLKARKQKDKERDIEQRTPQSIKRTLTSLTVANNSQTNSETSPLLIIQQCLDLLVDLTTKNPHVSYLFLTEHEAVGATLKRSLSRKGKTKDTRAHKFAINSLLTLLDRDLVMESSIVMTHLADLLNRVTLPLLNLERRRREAAEREAEHQASSRVANAADSGPTSDLPTNQSGDNGSKPGSTEKLGDVSRNANKKPREMLTPIIPHQNLTLVVRIFVARECSSKTFQNTISTIKNLSAIEGAKSVFGQELVRQARALSENIVSDLDELLPQIEKAVTGTEIQGVALAKFSPGASEQNKLLRVLTALDHLFKNVERENEQQREKDDLLISLYHNSTFSTMWEKLSACLRAIHKRENMINVATILLPLIESLMVVCKNTTASDEPISNTGSKDLALTSPPAELRTANLFFNFTEEHRRILNELVRNNPKLMSGTFSLLVKNPKVLEFDNKRNYFNRSVHTRSGAHARATYPSLQLSVRREHVFLDSFKHLYFKTGDEMKFGKLNIRFNGEEGVDAGGVSREWFQVMARQMFDPNYALFVPVSSDRTTFHPNNLSGINEDHLMFFKFIGRIIGKALFEGRLLDCYFSRAVYKRILGKTVSVKDMESFDPDYYKSLCWMLDNDITGIITETFSVDDDVFGVVNTVDLKPGGRDIPVTQENKEEYVRLVVEHKLLSSVKDQMENFLKGFHEIIPAELISIFNEQELELLISGLPDIDVDDWKSNTEYQNYTPSSQQIQWFWRVVRSFDKEERAKLLQFVTGTSKVPLNGFKELEGMNGVNRFNIHRAYGDKNRLPTSHTCFNQLDLPEYDSYDSLRSQIVQAITAGSEYFGFA